MQNQPNYNRRNAVILSADVVGYSRAISRDDELTVTVLRACRELIRGAVSRHEGRVFGSAGDSFMLEFANPLEALRCAIEIQQAIRRRNTGLPEAQQMWFRTGISSGNVIDDDGALHGECVNVAARLQESCPTGGVAISELVHADVCGKVATAFRSLGELPFKNIPRPIRVFEVVNDDTAALESAPALSIIDLAQPIPGFEGRPALAVLPFDNETSDPRYAYLSDGFSEDLLMRLSHLRWLPVIDRNSSFAFRGLMDPLRIGKLLGARYVLEGGLRVEDGRLRVAARLLTNEAAHLLWSARYDIRISDLMATLDEIAASIIGTLEGRIEEAEQVRARGRRQSRLETRDLIWRGRWHLNRLTRDDAEEARRLFDEAVTRDPESAEALIHLAWWTFYDIWTQRRSREHTLAFKQLAHRALVANELDSRGHFLAGCSEILLRNPDAALLHLEQATRLNPSSAYAFAQIGSSEMLAGRPERAIAPLKTALRLNPHDHYVFYVLGELAAVHCMLGRWDEAIALADKSLGSRPAYWHARMTKIAALVGRGNRGPASDEVRTLRSKHPRFSRKYIEWLPYKDPAWIDFFANAIAQAAGGKLDWSEQKAVSGPDPSPSRGCKVSAPAQQGS